VDKIWLTGASGLLGGWAAARFRENKYDVFDARVDLTDEVAVQKTFHEQKPSAIVHCAAISAIADCARDPARARKVNVEATATLARLCAEYGSRLVHVSSDLVFDGEAAPYAEGAPTAPLSIYARTKVDAERAALAHADSNAVVARVALLFGPTRTARRGFFDSTVAALRATDGPPLRLFEDEWRTPLSLRRAAQALHLLVGSDETGIINVGGPERMSRLEMGRRLARVLGVSDARIEPASRMSAPNAPNAPNVTAEPRPRDVSLDSNAFRERFSFWLSKNVKKNDEAYDFESECRAMLAVDMAPRAS
jgi:dTDP-4-dehydrorhamnose reductase